MDINSFSHPRFSKKLMKDYNFKYSRGWSDECEAYVAYFPIYRSNGVACLSLRVVVYEDGDTRIDVLDSSSNSVYAPWYRHEDYSRYPILKEVDQNIAKLMTSMGFKERGKHEKCESSSTERQLRRSRTACQKSRKASQGR